MPKYIDFDALVVQSCNPDVFVNKGYAEGWNSLMRMLYDAPAADVEPVRHGRWVHVTNGRGGFECNLCSGYAASYQSGSDYLSAWCPNCGAKMDKEEA